MRRGRGFARSLGRVSSATNESIAAAPSDGAAPESSEGATAGNQASPDGNEYTRTMIVDNSDQQYMFTRDICVVCGSLGKGVESDLIPCAECGQCYHLYCADVKLNPVVVQRGWRCLNCTICEGCGSTDDEQHLLLCDECDYSIHTYCLNPPLNGIPTGSWTCQWCSRCGLCEAPLTAASHKLSSMKDNLLKFCLKCESRFCCPLCRVNYKDKDAVIKCEKCQKWSHSKCNGLISEEAVENAAGKNFKCALCRPGYVHTLDDNSPEKLPEILHNIDGVLMTKIGAASVKWRSGAQQNIGRRCIGTGGMASGAKRAIDDVVDSIAALFSDRKANQGQDEANNNDLADFLDEETFKHSSFKWARRFKVGLGGFSVKQVRHRFGQHTSASGKSENSMADAAVALPCIGSRGGVGRGFQSALSRRKRQRRKGQLDEAYPSYIQEAFFGYPANYPLDKVSLDCSELESAGNSSTGDKNDGNVSKTNKASTGSSSHGISESTGPEPVDPLGREATASLFGEDTGLQSSSDFSNILDMLMNEDIDDVLAASSFTPQSKPFSRDGSCGSIEALGHAPIPPQIQRPTQLIPQQGSVLAPGQSTLIGNRFQNPAVQIISQQRPGGPLIIQQSQRFAVVPTDQFAAAAPPPIYSAAVQSLQAPPTFGPPPANQPTTQILFKHQGPGGQVPPHSPPVHPTNQRAASRFSPAYSSVAAPLLDQTAPTSLFDSSPAAAPRRDSSVAQAPPAAATPTNGGGGTALDSRSTLDRWESDEPLGDRANTAAVLYTNLHHAHLKFKYPHWPERAKQISKLWRTLSPEQRQRFVLLARENRTLSRQQISGGKIAGKNSEDTCEQTSPVTIPVSPHFSNAPPDMLFKIPSTPAYMPSEYAFQGASLAQQKPPMAAFGAQDPTSISASDLALAQQQHTAAHTVTPTMRHTVKLEVNEGSFPTNPPPSPRFPLSCQFGQSTTAVGVQSPAHFMFSPSSLGDVKPVSHASFATGQSAVIGDPLILRNPIHSPINGQPLSSAHFLGAEQSPRSLPAPPTTAPVAGPSDPDPFRQVPLQQNRDLQYEKQLLEAELDLSGEQKTLEYRLAELRRHKKALVFKRKQQLIKAGLLVEGPGPVTGLDSDGRLLELTQSIGELQKLLEPVKRRAKQQMTLMRDYKHRCGVSTPPLKSIDVSNEPGDNSLRDPNDSNAALTCPQKVNENNAPKRKWSRRKRVEQVESNGDNVAHEVARALTDVVNSVLRIVDGDETDFKSHSLLKTLLRSSSPTADDSFNRDCQTTKFSAAAVGLKRQPRTSSGVADESTTSRPATQPPPPRKRSRKQTGIVGVAPMTSSSVGVGGGGATASAAATSFDAYAVFLQRLAVKLAAGVDESLKRRGAAPLAATTQLREPPPRCDAFSIKLGVTSLADKIVKTFEKSKKVGDLKLDFASDIYSLSATKSVNQSIKAEVSVPTVVMSNNIASKAIIRPQIDATPFIGRVESPSDFVYGSLNDYEEDLQSASYPALKPCFGGDGRISPNFRLTAHVPVRAQPPDPPHSALDQMTRSRSGFVRNSRHEETISVTLTLSADASRDIGRVLSGLAALLGMDVPSMDYELRLDTPPTSPVNKACLEDRKLTCCACKVYVEQAAVRKKYSELGLASYGSEEEAVFCSSSCFDRFITRLNSTNSKYAEKSGPVVSQLPRPLNRTDQSAAPSSNADVRLDEIISCVAGGSGPAALDQSTAGVPPPSSHAPSPALTSLKMIPPPSGFFVAHPSFPAASSVSDQSKRGTDDGQPIKMYGGGSVCEQLLNVRDLESKFNATCDELVGEKSDEKAPKVTVEFKLKGSKWLIWSSNDKTMSFSYDCTIEKLRISLKASLYRSSFDVVDQRICQLCTSIGDDNPERCGRLLNMDAGQWVHVNCALWSAEVYETMDGGLVNVDRAVQRSQSNFCTVCDRRGATLPCYKLHCASVYHFACAVEQRCAFLKDKTLFCPEHVPFAPNNMLTDLSVLRRIFIDRDEDILLAKLYQQGNDGRLALRIGSLIFRQVGQLSPHQMKEFYNEKYIFPVGYTVNRIFLSTNAINRRVMYSCQISEAENMPRFELSVEHHNSVAESFFGRNATEAWMSGVLRPIESLRACASSKTLKFFPSFLFGEYLFGLTEPGVQKMIESLPGADGLIGYELKFGRRPLIDVPLAVNPSGCSRCEPRCKTYIKSKSRTVTPTQHLSWPALLAMCGLGSESQALWNSLGGRPASISKWSQYRKMKQDWKNSVYLARSKIQGLGLYAKRNIEMNAIVIEYIGQVIRNEVAERREKKYEEHGRGVYMFRMDHERVIDATMCGGLARYANHSCDPNCITDSVLLNNGDIKIVITACRPITEGEELTYDYQFDFEDDARKIPCLCAAPNCRKWMN